MPPIRAIGRADRVSLAIRASWREAPGAQPTARRLHRPIARSPDTVKAKPRRMGQEIVTPLSTG